MTKKSTLLFLGLMAAAFFCLSFMGLGQRAGAQDPHPNHCVCGNAAHATAANGHECLSQTEIDAISWQPVSDVDEIMALIRVENGTDVPVHDVYIYLTQDITLTSGKEIGPNWKVNNATKWNSNLHLYICLNGHKLTSPANARVFYAGDDATRNYYLSVCDCDATADSGVYANSGTTTGSVGGLVYMGNGHYGSFYNVKFFNGISNNVGGNILLCQADRTKITRFYDCRFEGGHSLRTGTSSGSGGNIALISSSKAYFYYCTIMDGIAESSGTATALGGNVAVTSGDAFFKGCTIEGGSCVVGDTAKQTYGANLYVYGTSDLKNTVTMEDTTVGSLTNQHEVGRGGNAYVTVSGGKAGQAQLILNSGTEFIGGTANYESGGSVYVANGGYLEMNAGASIHDGTVTASGKGGGNVCTSAASSTTNTSGVFKMNGGEIYNGSATSGAGNVRIEGIFYMNGGTIRDPKKLANVFVNIAQAVSSSRAQHAYMEMTGGTIKDPASGDANVSLNGGSNGSGVSYLNSVFRMSGGTLQISSGKTGRNIYSKGAVYISGTALLKHEGTMNSAGANIYMYDGTTRSDRTDTTDTKLYHMVLEITGGTIEGGTCQNTDYPQGGCIYMTASTRVKNKVKINNATIQNGKVDGGGTKWAVGGNVYLGNVEAEIVGSTIKNGTVIQTASGTARGFGGNLYCSEACVVTIENSVIESGRFESVKNGNGRNICMDGTATIQGANTKIRYTSQTGSSGGNSVSINSTNGSITFENGYIDHLQTVGGSCTATINGGQVDKLSIYLGTATVNGGRVGLSDNYVSLSEANAKLYINGGYIIGEVTLGTKNATAVLSGGYYRLDPTAALAASTNGSFGVDCYAFTGSYANPDGTDATVYTCRVAKGYVIETAAKNTDNSDAGIRGSVSGGGLYPEGADVTLKAYQPFGSDASGYAFKGWYLNDGNYTGAPLSTSLSYTLADIGDATELGYAAVYEAPAGNVTNYEVTVNGGAFSYAIAGGASGTGSNGTVLTVSAGSSLTLTYTGDGSFDAWMNESKKIVGRDTAYTFTVNSSTTVTANTASTGSLQVIFYTDRGLVIQSLTIEELYAITFPTAPWVIGKKDDTKCWKVGSTVVASAADVEAAAGAAAFVNVFATYEDDENDTYTVTVVGKLEGSNPALIATWTDYAAGNTGGTAVKGSPVMLTALDTDKYFLYYADAEGNEISTFAETAVRFVADTTIYAVYGDSAAGAAEPTVTMITKTRDGNNIFFEALRDVPAGYTLVEQGLIFTHDAKRGTTAVADALQYTSSAAIRYQSNGMQPNDVTGLVMKNVPANTTIYAVGYVVYLDGGVEKIVYSEIAVVD